MPSSRSLRTAAATAVLPAVAATSVLVPNAPAAATEPTFTAQAVATVMHVDTTVSVPNAAAGPELVDVGAILGVSGAQFDRGGTPESSAAAETGHGGVTVDGVTAQFEGAHADQQAPPPGNPPLMSAANTLILQPAGPQTAFSAVLGGYTVHALPVDPVDDPVAMASTTSVVASLFPDPVAGVPSRAATTISSTGSAATTAVTSVAGVRGPSATATVQPATFTVAGYTVEIGPTILTAVATGSASSSSVQLTAPVVTYGGNGVAAGTPLPADGLSVTTSDQTVTVAPGELETVDTGTHVSGSYTSLIVGLSATPTTTDPTTVTSTVELGSLLVRLDAPAPTSSTTPTPTLPVPPVPVTPTAVPTLAATGAPTTTLALVGLALTGLGAGLVSGGRRRPPSAPGGRWSTRSCT